MAIKQWQIDLEARNVGTASPYYNQSYLATGRTQTPYPTQPGFVRETSTPTYSSRSFASSGGGSYAATGTPSGASGGSSSDSSGSGSSSDAETPQPLADAGKFFDTQPEWSYYKPMDEPAMRTRAQELADMYSAPQYSQLERKLEQAIADAAAQEERIRAAYAGTTDAFARRETEQARLDLERAIARGAGRSGVVNFMDNQRQQHFAELLAAEEAKRNAELYNVANQLALAQRQVPDQRMEIAEQAGRLINQELQRLQDLQYTRGREHDLDQWERALSVFDRTQLTPVEQLAAYIQLAQVMGKTGTMPSIHGTFG